jgi:hypothetical protein
MTNNNGFWIGWLDLLTPSSTVTLNYNQLQQLTIDDCLRLSPFLTGLRVYSLLLWLSSDLRIGQFYEWGMKSHMSSHLRTNHLRMATAFWLLFRLSHDWLERRLHSDWITTTQWIMCPPFITLRRTEERSPFPTVHVIACLSVAAETCVNSVVTLWFLQAYPLPRIRA